MKIGLAQTYICTLQKSFTASLKNEYQYIKILCKLIINNKNNQQNMFVTLIDTRFWSLCDAYYETHNQVRLLPVI